MSNVLQLSILVKLTKVVLSDSSPKQREGGQTSGYKYSNLLVRKKDGNIESAHNVMKSRYYGIQ